MAENAQRVTLGPFIDDGEVIGGVLLYHFAAGTNNDLDIWDDRGKEITLENPIRADENGVFNFFADGLYKFVICQPNATTPEEGVLYTWDNFSFVDATDTTIERGDAVNSASTVPIGPGYWQHILGSISISAFSGTLPFFWAVFDGSPTLVHSSSLILPGLQNRNIQSGDVGFFLNEGNGVWRMAMHMENDGGYRGRLGTAYAATPTMAVGADGDFVDIGGNDVDITAIATRPAGYHFTARFTGSGCQLIHSNNLILPYSADYRLVTNELVEFRSFGSGIWFLASRSGPSAAPGVFQPIFNTVTHDGFLHPVGTAIVASRYRALAKCCIPLASTLGTSGTSHGTVTFANASDEWTMAAHGLVAGDIVHLTNSGGGLPSGFTANTVYFVVSPTTNTFKLSLTYGGSAVDGTTNGTGTHTVHNKCQIPDIRGRALVALDNLGGSAANIVTSASTNGANASTLGGKFGSQTHTLTVGEMPAHDHEVSSLASGAPGSDNALLNGNATPGQFMTSQPEGGSNAHSNTTPSMTVGAMIRW